MRSHLRTIVVLALAVGAARVVSAQRRSLAAWSREIVRARPEWLALSLATMFVNLAIRAWRWQYLLEPLGAPSFGNAFRATAVGFAASSVLPARAGEVIRPYFLARHERMSATGAFATIILERCSTSLTVLVLLASFVFVFGTRSRPPPTRPRFAAVKWAGAIAGGGRARRRSSCCSCSPAIRRGSDATLARLEQVLPSALAGLIARIAEKFARGLGAIRRPGRLLVALALVVSAVAVDRARHLGGRGGVPPRDAVHRLVPAAGAAGASAWRCRRPARSAGFTRRSASARRCSSARRTMPRSARRSCCTPFTIGPSLLLGLFFAAQEGLNLAGMRQLADQAEPGRTP